MLYFGAGSSANDFVIARDQLWLLSAQRRHNPGSASEGHILGIPCSDGISSIEKYGGSVKSFARRVLWSSLFR
jgi:hypothetical protein